MKAARLYEYDESLERPDLLVVEEIEEPRLERRTDVIVRVGGAGVCRTDLHVIEGLWADRTGVELPYVLGHENAGWVEEVGAEVTSVSAGDAVICHPLVTSGHGLNARRGDDMHAEDRSFPGINADGGFAEYLLTNERALVKLPAQVAPKDAAAYADAGLTAYRAAKKASRLLLPGEFAVVLGVGGLGHIAVQVLKCLCAAEIIAVDRSELALTLAEECGADHLVKSDGSEVEQVLSLAGGKGAQAVIDFVGEGDAVAAGLAMTREAGTYYVVGYGGEIRLPTMEMIVTEKSIVGNLVGTYAELAELMVLADRGLVTLSTAAYTLADVNAALHDLHAGRIKGRAILVP